MKSILVATDLSVRSERAVRRAFALAEQHSSSLTVLCVVDEDLPEDLAKELRETSAANVTRFCKSVSQHPHDVRVDIGDPQKTIHAVADALKADLIVLGTHRSRVWADMVTGTTMERLVRGTSRPVLLVQNPVDHDYRRVVCGLDLSPSCLAALEMAAALAPQSTINTFHAVDAPFRGFLAPADTTAQVDTFAEEAKTRVEGWLQNVDLPANCQPVAFVIGGVREALHQMMTKAQTDLIAVGAHSRVGLSPSYLGGFTQALLRNPPCDILVVRQ